MRKPILIVTLFMFLCNIPVLAYESLYEVYSNAGGNGQYDKYLELNPDIEYLGDLNVVNGVNAYIDGHGAIIHGQDSRPAICVSGANLHLQNCVIVGGYGGVYLASDCSAMLVNNTITGCFDSGVKSYSINYSNTQYWNNIITDCYYGIYCVEYERPYYIAYNTIHNTTSYRYAEYCPG